jgi:transglutaminase-like putative cysteine protease
VPKALALQPPAPPPASEHVIAVDRRLVDHTTIRRLALSLRGDLHAADLWPELTDGPLLRREAGQASTAAWHGDELAATALLPVGHSAMVALAESAVGDIRDRRRQAAALTQFVHDFLRYEDGVTDRSVLDLVERPSGDCTEFADLLTTLARTLGIPGRTVFGLAYADGDSPAFRFHAWNELWVDDGWLVVDPTWNQLVVDATHIPLPADPALALQLLSGALALTFEVREIEYF